MPDADADWQELADLQAVLEDMYDKVDELKQVLKEYLSTKNSIKVFVPPYSHRHCMCDVS